MRKLGLVQKAIKIRLYPNSTQKKWLDINLRNTTDFYNYLLGSICDFSEAFDDNGKVNSEDVVINWDIINSNSKLQKLKDRFLIQETNKVDSNGNKIDSTYRDITLSDVYQQVSRNLVNNFKTFRDLNRGLPRFKSNYNDVSFNLLRHSRDIHLVRRHDEKNHGTPYDFLINDIKPKKSSKLSHNIGWLRIPSIDKSGSKDGTYIKCFCPCDIKSKDISSVRFKRESTGYYYASITLKNGCLTISDPEAKDIAGAPIIAGIDMNLSSDSRISIYYEKLKSDLTAEELDKIIEATTPYKSYFNKLRKLQQELSRKELHSKNWEKTRIKLAKLYKKIDNIRLDFIKKAASIIAKNFQKIALEDLSINSMKKGKPRFIQRLFNDACLYKLRESIIWRCNLAGREIHLVSPEYTSKTCSNCGFLNSKLTLNMRSWTCPQCNTKHHRDINAAKNIRNIAIYSYRNWNNALKDNNSRKIPLYNIKGINNPFLCSLISYHIGEEVVSF